MDKYELKGFYIEGTPKLNESLISFDRWSKKIVPNLIDHFVCIGIFLEFSNNYKLGKRRCIVSSIFCTMDKNIV